MKILMYLCFATSAVLLASAFVEKYRARFRAYTLPPEYEGA